MSSSEERRVDEEGRVTIPRAFRESLHIDSGDIVDVKLEDGRIVVQPRVSRDELVDELAGVIDEETRAADTEPTDPAATKSDWTSDLPDR